MATQWAHSFTGRRKKEKKMGGVRRIVQQGLVDEDLVLTLMPKRELLQSSAKGYSEAPKTANLPPLAVDDYVTGQSGRACQRMLRYYDTAVVDVLFGPDCAMAYKALCRTWSGDHPLFCGGSRKNEDVGVFFQGALDTAADTFIGRDATLYDLCHGPEAHAFFFKVMRKAGFFQTPEHAKVFSRMFPQTCKWQGLGTFVTLGGMASGAVWTTLMNTIINGLTTTYASHRASGAGALHDFLAASRYRAAYAGDDSATYGVGLLALESKVVSTLSSLGYIFKSTPAASLWRMGFLGCTPMACERWTEGRWAFAITMVPIPHRFLTTLGWALDEPADPRAHCAGVGLGWYASLGHVPGYGALVANMAAAGGVTFGPTGQVETVPEQVKSACDAAFGSWAEFSASANTSSLWRPTPDSVSTLAMAWGVSTSVIAAFAADCAACTTFPSYLGTPSVHAVAAATLSV
jgi:hypothetical protein